MERFHAITLVMNALLIINFCLGIASWFAYEINQEGYIELLVEPSVSIEYNETDLTELSDSLKNNYGIGAGAGFVETAYTVLWAIPNTAANMLEIAQVPDALNNIILAALHSFLGFAYIIFGFEIWSLIRGNG